MQTRPDDVSAALISEDAVLSHLRTVAAQGFYIDFGTPAPDAESLTQSLYEAGWSGVNVARDADSLAALQRDRPRDVNLPHGAALADIWQSCARGPVHVLRADPADGASLDGLGGAPCRPWIVLARSASPAWDPGLLDVGYRFVGATPLHRVYAAPETERADPPVAAQALIRTQADLALASAWAQSSAARLLDATRALGALRVVADERAGTVVWQRGVVDTIQAGHQRLQAESSVLQAQAGEQHRTIQDQASKIGAMADEVAWLRGCLADGEAALEATRQARNAYEQRVLSAEGQAAVATARAVEAERVAAAAQQAARAIARRPLRASAARLVRLLRARLRRDLAEPVPALHAAAPAALPLPPPPEPASIEPAPTEPTLEPVGEPIAEAPTERPPEPDPSAPPPKVAPELDTPLEALPQHPTPAPRRPVHIVHQFHADAAIGDAITNAMLALRGVLRAMGYESDIFVVRWPAALEHDLRPAASLPRHDGYVLLAHHSMGYAEFADILALPARKVLVYHNITPPEWLAHAPRLQHNAALGRAQLADWRDHATAALALSEYSAGELRRLGFNAVRSCNLLFDLDALRQSAMAARVPRTPGPFTILFVGRITASKAQDDLIAAYMAFCRRYEAPSRLVLVGGFDAEDYAYLDRLNGLILDHALSDRVLLTGLVSDAERDGWYARADLYVSLSHHEGFGVPLVEAMAHGVPVLAWPAGAVPYTLGGAGALLASRAPEDVAGRMLVLAEDPAECRAIAARQTASLSRFALPGQLPLLREALALAGAQPRPAVAVHASLAGNAHLAVAGHVNKTYSLAAINRAIAAAFEAQRPGGARLIPVEGKPTDFLGEVPPECADFVARLAARPPAISGPEIVLSQHYPVYVPKDRGDLTLALTVWEESLLPAETVKVLNAGFDAVLTPSGFAARVLVDSGVALPVIKIGQPAPLVAFAALSDRPARTPFTFLHVSSAFPRKGLDALLAAWRRAFRARDAVRLVIKTFPNIHNDAAAQIDRLRAIDPDAAAIQLVDQDLDEATLLALYAGADAMVLPTRGEGYNLPAAEAMAAGLKLIVTDTGGHRDFCGPGTARLIRSRPAPARTHLASAHSLWREPDVDDLTAALQEVVRGVPPGQVAAARAAALAAADGDGFVNRLTALAARLILAGPPPPARLAWITSWDVRCGVAGYARALLDAMPRDGVARLAILCDDRTPDNGDTVRPCWSLGATGTDALVAAVQAEDSDVVMVQHQPGLLGWTALAGLLTALVADGRVVVVTLHNTVHLLEVAAAERDAAVTALRGVARVLVHTIADLDRLEALGLQPVLLPHGAPAPRLGRPARTLQPGSAPIIGCYGFFLPGKGIGTLIEAVAALRTRWPRIDLHLVNADYGSAGSAQEIAACRAIATACGLAVEWHLDFLPEAGSAALLAGCDLIVLPYAPSPEASSAAARSALASGVPLAVTPIALFDDLGDAVARLPGGDVAAVADGIAALLDDPEQRDRLSAAARRWLAERAVPDIAGRLAGLQRGLAAQRWLGVPLDGATWSGGGRQ